jgi:hypothetical protein
MNRRTALKVAAGSLIGGGAGVFTLTTAFKPTVSPPRKPQNLKLTMTDSNWIYHQLDPVETANLTYSLYDHGSCMYAIVHSFISQLAAQFGEPYASFPSQMMKYGHGGIGGYGTVCGALNGAAALIGLFVIDKDTRDALITDLFRWYEKTPLPVFTPAMPILNYKPLVSVSRSTLCHASNTCWVNKAGYRLKSKQRKERCRRLTGDVTVKLATIMNHYNDNSYTTTNHDDKSIRTCMTCHGKQGKMGNTGGKMTCTSCHSESLEHRIFSDVHYKLMDKY